MYRPILVASSCPSCGAVLSPIAPSSLPQSPNLSEPTHRWLFAGRELQIIQHQKKEAVHNDRIPGSTVPSTCVTSSSSKIPEEGEYFTWNKRKGTCNMEDAVYCSNVR